MHGIIQFFRFFNEPRHDRVDWYQLFIGLLWAIIPFAFYSDSIRKWFIPFICFGLFIGMGGLAELLPRQWRKLAAAVRIISLIGLIFVMIWFIGIYFA
jgi:hypothetical protein